MSIGITGIKNDRMIQTGYAKTAGFAYIPHPIIMDRAMLKYHPRLFTYIYMNLQPATVLASNGSDMSISYSLKLKRYPFVLKNVKKNESILIVITQMAGIASVIPICP